MNIKRMWSKYSSEICIALAGAGYLTSIVLTAKATPRAMELIEEAKAEKGDGEELTTMEVVKTAAKPYIPTIVVASTSTALLIAAGIKNAKTKATLAGLATAAEKMVLHYKDAIVETLDESEANKVNEKVNEKVMNDAVERNVVNSTASGYTLVKNCSTGSEFYVAGTATDAINTIREAVIRCNERMQSGRDFYISEAELLYEMGDSAALQMDDILGFSYSDGLIQVQADRCLNGDDVMVLLRYVSTPRSDYYRISR